MSDKHEDGGPAFPGEKAMRFGEQNDCNEGMTLRDYFAAKAMEGALSNAETVQTAIFAGWCYEMADAMLKARQS